MKNNSVISFGKKLYKQILKDEVTALSAQVTYYVILSFFPFLLFIITIVSYTPIAQEDVVINLSKILPKETYDMIIRIINETVINKSTSLISAGMIGTLWAASNGMRAIIKGINKAYNEEENRNYFILRGFGILLTIAIALAILFSLTAIVFGEILSKRVIAFLGLSIGVSRTWEIYRYVFSIVSLILIFAFIYKYSPNCKIKFRSVLPGAIFTTFGWIATSLLFSKYINNFSHYATAYGSLGAIIILLIWLYISCIIILLGGEINAILYSHKNVCNNNKR